MIRVEIKPAVLQWAVDRSGNRSALEHKFPKLAEWLSGTSWPTLKQIETLALATLTPFGYFFLDQPPEERLPIPYFRSLSDHPSAQPSAELLETVYTMERRQSWLRDYLMKQGHDPLPFVGSAPLSNPPILVADRIRSALGLEMGWAAQQPTWTDALRYLQRQTEDSGILLVVNGIVGNNTHRKLNVEEFRGFVLVDEYAPLVFINGADSKAAQMFTLAHELAHIWIGKSAAFDLRELQPAGNAIEQACNRAAAELLIPDQELRPLWHRLHDNAQRYQQVARQFRVSELVAARRALDLKLIDRAEFLRFYRQYAQKEQLKGSRNKGGNFYATQKLRVGRRLAEAVVHAVGEGELLYREAYQLTGLYGKAFEQFAASMSSTEGA